MARIHDWAQKAKEGQERLKLCPARLQLGLLGRVEGEGAGLQPLSLLE